MVTIFTTRKMSFNISIIINNDNNNNIKKPPEQWKETLLSLSCP